MNRPSPAGLVAERAAEHPDRVAVLDGDERITYGELAERAARLAAALRDDGVGDGDVVGVCMPRSAEAVLAYVGIAWAGAAYLPVNPEHPAARRRVLVEHARAARVLADGAAYELAARGLRPLPAPPGGDRLAYVLFTSGSTGRPKGVEIAERSLVHLMRSGADIVARPDDVVLHVVPLDFDVSGLEIWGALLNGATLVVAPRGRPDPLMLGELIVARGITYACPSTGVFHELVRAALPSLAGMRMIVPLGDVLSPAAAAELRAAHPELRLINGYGPTEATIAATAHEVDAVDGGAIPIGKALPGYRTYVLDDDRRPVRRGELWIGGAGVARGYRDDRERTAQRFLADPFAGGRMYRTGDAVELREDGELVFLGRLDAQVKISGQRVEPGEVEHVLASHPAVHAAAVVAREDVPGHKRLVGYATLKPGAAAEPAALRAHLTARLPPFMVPYTVLVLDELPLTDRGKVDRTALPAPARRAGTATADPYTERVAALMAEVVRLPQVGPDDDFFLCGGDSLLSIQLVGRLRDRLGAELDVSAVFRAPTPRALAAEIRAANRARPALPTLEPGGRGSDAPVGFAQRRALLFERMHPGSIAYQFSAVFGLAGPLSVDALREALGDLLARHEILRTGFPDGDGEPAQSIRSHVPTPLQMVDLRGRGGGEWARAVRACVRTKIDRRSPPLVRWTLIRTADERWSLVHVEHHLIHDGWSFTVLADELAELYSARAERRAPRLPELRVQFQDYARWEREALAGAVADAQLAHWRATLDPDPPLLELPADRPRPARESFAGGSVRHRLPEPVALGVRELARREAATPFMVTLAAFAALLARACEHDDVQIGSGLANRRDPASEGLIGMIVNVVVMRIRLDGDPTVSELIGRVREVALEAYDNADVPFDAVVEALRPPRDAKRSPLIQTLFSFHDAPRGERRWAGLETRLVQALPNGSAKADLNVIGVDDRDGGLSFVWEHSDLMTDATAGRLADHHGRLLEQFVERPQARLSELRLPEESRAVAPPRHDAGATIHELVASRAAEQPDAVAVAGEDGTTSYRALVERARAVAGALRGKGVAPGDRVGVLVERSAASAIAPLGVLLAGAAYVPLDPKHPPARIARALADAGVGVVLAPPALAKRLPGGVAVLDPERAERHAAPDALPEPRPGDLAYVMYTSGSTGQPKGVAVTHGNVVRLVQRPTFASLGPGTTMLHAASQAFDAATLEVWGPLVGGGAIAPLREHPSPDGIAAAVQDRSVTTMWLTAGLFHELVDRRPECLRYVAHVLAGGDVLSPEHVRRALTALPPSGRLTNGYGPTETTTFATTFELRPGDRVEDPLPIGRPIGGTVCEVVDTRGRTVPVGFAGELWIGGDGVARGYLGDAELTAERFAGGRYRTGDRVRMRADGVLEFLGRLDRQVKVRGVRVEPAEVERALREHPQVADAAVAVHGEDRRLVAYVVAPAGAAAPAPASLRAHATARLPEAMVPAAWVALPRLPLAANGKVDRDRLPAPGREHLAAAPDPAADQPRDDVERTVVGAFEEVLDVRPVAAGDDFFALGGHSLLAVALFVELERATGRRLPLGTIFEAPTPRALADRLRDRAYRPRWDSLVPLKPEGRRPPLFVVSAGDGNVVGFGPLARRLSADQPLYALQPAGLDGRGALDEGIEAMAERYVAAARDVQPSGPYLLAGRCNGAAVAFEMAQQLRRAGEEVALLASLDSRPPPAGPFELIPGVVYDEVMEAARARALRDGQAVGEDLAGWLREPVAPGVSRYLYEAWSWREDLQAAFPRALNGDAAALAAWAWTAGRREMRLAAALIHPVAGSECPLADGRAWDQTMVEAWPEVAGAVGDPLSPAGTRHLLALLAAPVAGRVTRYALAAWRLRADLRSAFPDPTGDDAEAFAAWAARRGPYEGLYGDLLVPRGGPLPAAARLRLGVARTREAGAAARAGVARRAGELAAAGERRLPVRLPGARERLDRRVEQAARRARADYRAQPWPGRILLISSRTFADRPEHIGWGALATGGLEQVHLPAGHIEMIREPDVALLADCLERRIVQALDATQAGALSR